jgi:hypothetical protein
MESKTRRPNFQHVTLFSFSYTENLEKKKKLAVNFEMEHMLYAWVQGPKIQLFISHGQVDPGVL